MNQQTFLEQLRQGLSGLPQEEIEARLAFYSEMIDDQMEDGISEEDAVSSVGSVEDIVAQTVEEVPLAKIARERIRPKKPLRWVEILLLVLGSPIWLSLGIAVLAVLLACFAAIWAIVVALWAVFAALAAASLAALAGCVALAVRGYAMVGVAVLATGLVASGLTIFLLFAGKGCTLGIWQVTGLAGRWMKNCLMKREVAE